MSSVGFQEEFVPFRQQKSFEVRSKEAQELLSRGDQRVPIIIERAANEKFLPLMTTNKFLIPRNTSLTSVHCTIRVRLQLHQDQSFFLLANARHIPALTSTVEEVYQQHKSDDGFLYMTYASQEVFG